MKYQFVEDSDGCLVCVGWIMVTILCVLEIKLEFVMVVEGMR